MVLKIALLLAVIGLFFVIAMADSMAFGGRALAAPAEGHRLCGVIDGVRRCIMVNEVPAKPKRVPDRPAR